MENNNRSITSECYQCVHRRNIPGDCHSQCIKPDPNMTGSLHGIKSGWFFYPLNFDPTWKTKLCNNFDSGEKNVSK